MSYQPRISACAKCGAPKVFHHINGNPYDNRRDNLTIVCARDCNRTSPQDFARKSGGTLIDLLAR